ncbi:GGDEF domain-containing protein, partial [Anaerorhabdus sp.]
ALLMLDIDDFKDVNDRYGHAEGDRVLGEVAIELKERFRSRDIVGRVGGDEFTILMTDIPSKDVAIKKAEELCSAIRNRRFTKCEITVSIGIAFANDEKSFNEIYNEADEALYQAKNNGKNQFQMK